VVRYNNPPDKLKVLLCRLNAGPVKTVQVWRRGSKSKAWTGGQAGRPVARTTAFLTKKLKVAVATARGGGPGATSTTTASTANKN
jgi:hypothetical protein